MKIRKPKRLQCTECKNVFTKLAVIEYLGCGEMVHYYGCPFCKCLNYIII